MTHFSGFEGKLVSRRTPSSATQIHMPLSVGHDQTTGISLRVRKYEVLEFLGQHCGSGSGVVKKYTVSNCRLRRAKFAKLGTL